MSNETAEPIAEQKETAAKEGQPLPFGHCALCKQYAGFSAKKSVSSAFVKRWWARRAKAAQKKGLADGCVCCQKCEHEGDEDSDSA